MTEHPSARTHQRADHNRDTGTVAAQDARVIAELSTIALGMQPLTAVVHRIAELATQVVPAAEQAALTVIHEGQPRMVGFSGDLAAVLEDWQQTSGHGPRVDAAMTAGTITIEDTAEDLRYPQFARQAHHHGLRHVLAVAIVPWQGGTAVLSLYSSGASGPFTTEERDMAVRYAGHAAIPLANAVLYAVALDEIAQMKIAMGSRAVIEQAKGIIMRDHRCSADQAFTILAALTVDTARQLGDVAQTLTDTVPASGAPGERDNRMLQGIEPDLQAAAMNLVDGFDDHDMAALAQLTPAARAEQARTRTTLFTYTEQLWDQAAAAGHEPAQRSDYDAVSALRNLMDALCGHVDEAQQAAGDNRTAPIT